MKEFKVLSFKIFIIFLSHIIKISLPSQMYSVSCVQNCTLKDRPLLGGGFLNSPIIIIVKPLNVSNHTNTYL